MLPDYVIHEELKRLRREGCRERRVEIERPIVLPRPQEELPERSKEYNYGEGEKIEYHETIFQM